MGIDTKLQEVGLGEKETQVYLAVLQNGGGSVMEIAEMAGIKRPTAHIILEGLKDQGLISQTYRGKRRVFSAETPDKLCRIPQEQERKIRELLPELNALYSKDSSKPVMRYYEGKEGLVYANEQLLETTVSEYRSFTSMSAMLTIYDEAYMDDYVKRRIEQGIASKTIRIKAHEVDVDSLIGKPENKRGVRFFPGDEILPNIAALYITDTSIIILSSKDEYYAVIIESIELVTLMNLMWKTIWNISEKS